jgi:ABC-type multidrug transport system ATPase subunit
MVGLDDVINKKIKTFSKGMKKRLGIASVFLHKPEIYILDEPTTGLDPIIRVDFRNKIKELAKSGISFLLSSHVLAEIELESDRILIIDEGKKIKEGKTQELLTIPDNIIVRVEKKEEALKILSEAGEVTAFDEEGNITIKLKKDFTIDDIGTLITENKLGLISIQTQKVHLDDIFYQLTERDKE